MADRILSEADRLSVANKTKRNHGLISRNGRPKPNIVKIKVLSGDERQRYLVSEFQRAGDSVKSTVQEQLRKSGDDIFYGFINQTGGAKQGLKIGARWEDDKDGGGVLGTIKKLASDVAPTITNIVDTIGDIANDLTGVSATATGSSSLKRYQGVDIDTFAVDVGWYLPEQLHLCKKSLRTLNRMIYPLQLGTGDAKVALNEFLTGSALSELTGSTTGILGNTTRTISDSDNEDNVATVQLTGDELESRNSSSSSTAQAIGEFAIDAINKINNLFGRNLTFDPLPVRVWVGHYMDIEPLVITGMDISFSKETFRRNKPNGQSSDIPIFCNVTISFDYWMNPAPKMEFMSLIEQEMFGEHFHPDSEQDIIEIANKRAIANNAQQLPLPQNTFTGYAKPRISADYEDALRADYIKNAQNNGGL